MVTRRGFLASLSALTARLLTPSSSRAATQRDALGEILPTRRLGNTGESVTMLGLGGAHVSAAFNSREAETLIETSIEGGVRFFDTAHTYSNGESERRYGKYLTPKYREHIFLMTKAHLFDYRSVQQQLDESLLRMKTDYIDLWQMHQVYDAKDADRRISNGVLDAFAEAKQSGKVRHIGFTGHNRPESHLRVLERTDIFETCQMPINCADPSYGSFILNVLPKIVERNMGVIAMKTLAHGGFFGATTWFQESGERPQIIPARMSVREAIHFVWSLPVSTLVTGPLTIGHMKEKIELAKSFVELDENQRLDLIHRVTDLTPNAGIEFYKANGQISSCDWMIHEQSVLPQDQ